MTAHGFLEEVAPTITREITPNSDIDPANSSRSASRRGVFREPYSPRREGKTEKPKSSQGGEG